MYDDTTVFSKFGPALRNALIQTLCPGYGDPSKDATISPLDFPPFDAEDDTVELETKLSIPERYFRTNDERGLYHSWMVRHDFRIEFFHWLELDECEDDDTVVNLDTTLTFMFTSSPTTVCSEEDLRALLRQYKLQAFECFDPILVRGEGMAVEAGIRWSAIPRVLEIGSITMTLPCHLSFAMLTDETPAGLLSSVEPWVRHLYSAELRFFEFMANGLYHERMKGPDEVEPRYFTRMIVDGSKRDAIQTLAA